METIKEQQNILRNYKTSLIINKHFNAKKYVKVMFDNKSGALNMIYQINKINVAENWNPSANTPEEMGGFNFSTEDNIFRWLIRGDVIYDVEIPEGAQVVECKNDSTFNGVFRCNKIIITNPRKITDEIAMELYYKSNLPEKSYYKSLLGCAIRGYKNTCLQVIIDKINKDNVDLVLSEAEEFVTPFNSSGTAINGIEVYEEVMEILKYIKNH